MYDDAVTTALNVDLELAKECAKLPEDPEQQQHLWRKIITHVLKDKTEASVKEYARCAHHTSVASLCAVCTPAQSARCFA